MMFFSKRSSIPHSSYKSVFFGEFMQPDWDMFHSLHPMAEYHRAARAVGGCDVYVSDKPGNHAFDVLKKLVLPDDSTFRAKLPGGPTRDCLFSDHNRDGGRGFSIAKELHGNVIHDQRPQTISSTVQPTDIEYVLSTAQSGWNGDCVMY